MLTSIGEVALLVRDYDEAIRWFVDVLGFTLMDDTDQGHGKRWVIVGPPGGSATRLLLAEAVNDAQAQAVGRQAGGRVFLFLRCDSFDRDYASLKSRGVRFREEPRSEPYGRVVVFEDLYGNPWDLIQPVV